jgi:hypothetical protein
VNVEWLIGLACTRVSQFAEHTWAFSFADATLTVESLWRVSVEGVLRRTSTDHGQQFGLPQPVDAAAAAHELLNGRRIEHVELDRRRGDLALRFNGDVVLEVITDSAGYESWMLQAPSKHIVAGSGGTVHDLLA